VIQAALSRAWSRLSNPPASSRSEVQFPPRRRYPGLPIEMERDVIALEVLEGLLDEPIPDVEQVVRCVLS
jgi:hypothetical protein